MAAPTKFNSTQVTTVADVDLKSHKLVNVSNGVNDNDAANMSQLSGLLSTTSPAALGTAAVGTSTKASRADHIHQMPSASDVGAIPASQKGAANGVASLGPDAKVLNSQLPDSLFGAISYQGVWNADTNSPTIPAAASDNKGHYYKVSVQGATDVDGITDWKVGDWIVSNGTTWDKIDNTDQSASASTISFTPAGDLTSITVQAVIEELDGDKLSGQLPNGHIFLGIDGTATPVRFINREVPETVDYTVYTLAYTPIDGYEVVLLNGQELFPGSGNDYTINTTNKTITFSAALLSTDRVVVRYHASN